MATFKNSNWTRRNYEQTNIVAVTCDSKPTIGWNGQPADYWVEASDSILADLEVIGSFGGMKFWGYL